ncbi:DUF349 domain-containing protein [Moheibacter sediminis]|uniref:DUF349 domain-containing protein n=1 Tax=Moheibacter sediminis TaxID=1434700 RepID=A0A1W2BQR1_9FLAO|nr:DUF349 domain-containing protein [Moheibacter sediminis]SMC75280.1 protein of unknown function [Moheibacter sediminis]
MTTELDNLHNEADGENDNNLNPQPENVSESSEKEENKQVEEVQEETISEEIKPESESEILTEMPSEETSSEEFTAEELVEESEEEAIEEEIPFKNYESLPVGVLVGEAKELLKNHQARKLSKHFNQIREAVKKQLEEDEAAKKQAFVEEGGEALDFHYDNPARREFNAVYNDYRKQIDAYYKEQEQSQQQNLTERLQIIDELKSLYQDQNENNSNIFNQFRKLKTRWHNAGSIPKAQAGNVFKTYFHHLDNFYEYLNLNKELRELDFVHNLEVRYSIIKRAEELVQEENVQKALNELQYLHRLWKEEAVPVAEELREPTWQKFKELTNKIHDRKTELGEKVKKEQDENLAKKQEILAQFQQLTENAEKKSHGEWQSSIKKLNTLRENFLAIGRVPKEHNHQTWEAFKNATRDFNHVKNEFYKSLKSDQQQNLEKKQELLKIAKEHADSKDWNNSVQVIKKIQADWKKIGHVPRKYSDSIWKEFKDACNLFFEKYKDRNNQSNQEFEDNFVKKEAFLKEVSEFKPSGNPQQDLNAVNEFNVKWNSMGKVPAAKMSINSDFNKAVGDLVKSFGLSQNEIQDFKMASLVDQIKSGNDGRLLDDEIRKARKTIEELEKEINQLETNVGFFANADQNSPLLKDVYRQIEEKRSRLTDTEIRLRKLHRIDFEEEVNEPESEQNSEETEG